MAAPAPSADSTRATLLALARARLAASYKASARYPGLSAVSCQPLLSRANQDRVVTQAFEIGGQRWLLLAVCDGHAGSTTAEYTARRLPARIRAALTALATSTTLNASAQNPVSALLAREIESFDRRIGRALTKLIPDPTSLTAQDVLQLASDPAARDALQRAHHGSTLALALLNLDARALWSAGVGDSSIALSTPEGCRRLNELHSPTNPREYFAACMAHPGPDERLLLRASDRVLGALALTRALGDFALKLPPRYAPLFAGLPSTAHPEHLARIAENSRTPPYLSAAPHVGFVQWSEEAPPVLLLFSDGVDALVEGARIWHADAPSTADPAHVLGLLLRAERDDAAARAQAEGVLGHAVEPGWEGGKNAAVALLGHLLGGADVKRVARVVDQERLERERDVFRVDDTSIIVCDVGRAAREVRVEAGGEEREEDGYETEGKGKARAG